jgi:Zn-dependent protease
LSATNSFLTRLLVWAVPVIVAIILHEVMHGFVARLFGDDTAARAGRLTLNPLRHIDPFGTLIMPGILLFLGLPVFGYAKPVPVNFGRLRSRRIGMILVSAAGPLTNLVIATVSAIALRATIGGADTEAGATRIITLMLVASVEINVMLAVFNLIPLLPLDGGRVLVGLLPPSLAAGYARCERYGFPLLFLLLYMNWLGPIVNPPINAIVRALL